MPRSNENQAKENKELNAIRLQQLHPEFKRERSPSVKDTDAGTPLKELESFPGYDLYLGQLALLLKASLPNL